MKEKHHDPSLLTLRREQEVKLCHLDERFEKGNAAAREKRLHVRLTLV